MNNTIILQWNVYRSENIQTKATYHNMDECPTTMLNKKEAEHKEMY